MSIVLTVNGTGYDYPETGDQRWGPDATDWAQAVTNGMLQKAGGLFQLLAEVDFGTTYGIKSTYYKSRATNPASAGQVRLGNTESVSWRNAANGADLALSASASDRLQFASVNIPTISSADTLTNKTINGPDNTITNLSNTNIASSAAIAFSKLASLSSGNILVGSSGNVATSVAVSGDITISDLGVTAIGANKVTNGMLAQIATARFKGRTTASTGNVEDLTATQATALLNNVVGDSGSGGTKGLVPAPAAGDAAANKFLKADGTWVAPLGAGDVVGPASSTDSGFAKFDGTTGKLLKNSAATISNSDVAAAAAIALTKLAATTASRALVSDGSGFITPATTTATEIGYVNGVTSAIQTQLNAKAPLASPTFTGTIGTPLASSKVVTTSAGSALTTSNTSDTELSYLQGVTSAVQTQLDAKVAKSTLSAKGSLVSASAASTPAELTLGTNGYMLVVNTAQSTGLEWKAIGTVVQSTVAEDTWPIIEDQYGDLTSISLTAGTWSISYHCAFRNNAIVTTTRAIVFIGTVTGNNTTGKTAYNTNDYTLLPTASGSRYVLNCPDVIVTPSSTTTYYLKGLVATSGSSLVVARRITAVRIA